MSKKIQVPVINISEVLRPNSNQLNLNSSSILRVVENIRDACVNWGFFYIIGHGVPEELVNDLKSVSKNFFHQPKGIKKQIEQAQVRYDR